LMNDYYAKTLFLLYDFWEDTLDTSLYKLLIYIWILIFDPDFSPHKLYEFNSY
jgi:hypothetical protein